MITRISRMRWFTLSALAMGGAACGYSQPYRTSGPVLANEGVEVSVAGERCTVNRTAEMFPTTVRDDQLDLSVDLQLKNESDNPVLLAPDRLQMSEKRGGADVTMRPLQSGIVTVLPGETRHVPLEFQQRGDLDCHHELSLDPSSAVQMGGRKVALQPIHFTATR